MFRVVKFLATSLSLKLITKLDVSTMIVPTQFFPLEQLPLELRHAIWKLVLCPIEQPVHISHSGLSLVRYPANSLLQVNKAIRQEAGALYFLYNDFSLGCIGDLLRFIESIGAHGRQKIRKLTFDWRVKHCTFAENAFKWLRFCPKLRQLTIHTGGYSSSNQDPEREDWTKLMGLRFLKQTRGVETINVVAERGWSKNGLLHEALLVGNFEAALQEMKEPGRAKGSYRSMTKLRPEDIEALIDIRGVDLGY